MEKKIEVSFQSDRSCESPQVVIKAARKTEAIDELINTVEQRLNGNVQRIKVLKGDAVVLLDQNDISRIYIEKRRLVVCADGERYESRMSLSEFYSRLDKDMFVRISRFEVVNLEKVSGFDQSVAGTIKILFEDGSETWGSRRCLKDIRERIKKLTV